MRRAAALPVVLFSMAMVSALAVGGTYVTRQFAASVRTAQRHTELEPAAEQALAQAIVTWDSATRAAQLVGTVAVLPTTDAAGVRTESWVTRTSATTYWLVAEASGDARPVLRRRIGVVVRVAGGVAGLVSHRAWSELP
jgi:hypothetical protein